MTIEAIQARTDAIIAELSSENMQRAAEHSPYLPELNARYDDLHRELAELDRAALTTTHPASDPEYAYYVSVLDGTRSMFALGPFETHAEALAHVADVDTFLTKHDPRGPFYAYGTSRATRPYSPTLRTFKPYEPGRLNGFLGFTPADRFL